MSLLSVSTSPGHKVLNASWDSEAGQWAVTSQLKDGTESVVTGDFLFMCGGYYNYDEAYRPEFPGQGTFKGQVIHPQFWPEDLDYSGKESGCYRQRGNRNDPRTCDGRERRNRHDGAALAHLRGLTAC